MRDTKTQSRIYVWERILPYILVAAAAIGLMASLTLTYDKIQILKDQSYVPSCSINPVLSCGSVMMTSQAEVWGVPNTIFGIIGFSMLMMYGMALIANARFTRWMWLAAQAAATLGVAFMHYLFFQAVWRIGAICPWCFVVWMITIPVFWGITVCNIRAGNLKLPAPIGRFINKHNGDILGLWYVTIILILLVKFWYYWETLL